MSIRGVHTWEGTASARWPWVVMIVSIVAATIVGIVGQPVIALIVLLASIPAMAFTKIVVTTGPDGLGIDYGPFGWPSQQLDIARIQSAEVLDVNPLKWGGWGYRGSIRFFGRAAVNLRSGPGMILRLTNGKQFVVTVDEPALGVNVLNQSILMQPGGSDRPDDSDAP